MIGLLLIVVGILYPYPFTPSTPVAAPVVIGTALLVLAGRHELPVVNRALSWRPVVLVGLISYSLYLWHWPVFVLFRYYFVSNTTPFIMGAAVVIVTVCATASWRFVERPFRSRRMPIKTVLLSAGAGTVSLAAVAALMIAVQGFPDRFNQKAAAIDTSIGTHYRCPVSEYISLGLARACSMNLPSRNPADADVVLLGNSHAQMYAPVWTSIFAERGVNGVLVPVNSCLPTISANISRECSDFAQKNLTSVLALPHVRTVILGLAWSLDADPMVDRSGRVLDNHDNQALIAALDDLDDRLHRAGKQVILIGPIAMPGWDVPSTISRELAFGWPEQRPVFLPRVEFDQCFDTAIQHFTSQKDIVFVPAYKAQCRDDRCYYVMDGHSLYADDNHIAAAELWRFRAMFEAAYPEN